MGRARKQSLRWPKQLASAVQTSRRAAATAAALPGTSSGSRTYVEFLRSGMGVDCGLLREDGDEEAAALVGCFEPPTSAASLPGEASAWSSRTPPPVTKKVSSKTTSAGGEEVVSACSARFVGWNGDGRVRAIL